MRRWAALALPAVLLAGVTIASAAWTAHGSGQAAAQASVDFHAPTVPTATVAPAGATAAGGAVRPGGQFVVYANVSDPGSGVASAKVDVSSLIPGSQPVALSPCSGSCTIAGRAYAWSSSALNAGAGLAQGSVTVGIWGTDNVGNVGTAVPFAVIVDGTNPTVSAAAVVTQSTSTPGWVAQGGSYLVYANASDAGAPASGLATVTADVSGLTAGQTALALSACTSSCTIGGVTYGYKSAVKTAGSPIAEGSVSFSVRATDVAAGTATATSTVTVDDTAPAVTQAAVVTSATSAADWVKPGGTYLVYANVTEAGSGISTVKTNVNGLTAGQTALTLSACTSSCTIGGVTYGYKSASKTADAGIAEGPLAFTVTVTDKATNAATVSFSVTVDATAPTVTATAIANTTTGAGGWLKKSGVYNVYANVADGASGVSSVKANVGSITSGQTALALTACSTSCTVGGVTYAYKSANKTAGSTLAEGAIAYTISVTDRANVTGSGNGSVTIDNTAPVATGAAIATVATNVPGFLGQGKSYAVYGNATDTAGGIFKLTASVGNVTTGQTAVAMPACTSSCLGRGFASAALTANATLSAGSKTYTLTAQDLAGNSATTANQTVVVDNTAPAVAITFPLASFVNGWNAGCGTASTGDVCGTATDATAGITRVDVSFRQAAAPSLYWNPAGGGFSSATEILSAATLVLPSWSCAMAGSSFQTGTSYTLRAQATDAAGNTGTTSITFRYAP